MHKVVSVSQVTRTSGRSHQICPHIFCQACTEKYFYSIQEVCALLPRFFSPEALAQIPRVMYNKTEA